ncbi:hypothetical protein Q4511_00490 [Paracoccus sp. 1_MG-2023]|uniref:hypothetical protein n=1 Tax=unclassified Paracoccus (in: a-proteobacteria) TaxID=2688777 RepID=UPI001C0A37C5|nr:MULTISPECIES: hypothetical protein [unclassified Paracoccus (in: a-proteobacteria)]MBU2957765.1 hypothetical protein [Paracoccus sp. C2R09]MDO6667387.1 hypothetical protein [Paracoccus sp. 1_MG-2023]
MQVIRPVGRESAAKKYDILSALTAHGLSRDQHRQRLVLRLIALITTRYNWQRDELTMGQKEIARLWCVDERTVKRDMAKLRDLGWVTVKRQGARGRVSVLGLDLERILLDTRPAWDNIGTDYVQRMSDQTQIPEPSANVVPFRRDVPAPEGQGEWPRIFALLAAEDRALADIWLSPLTEIGRDDAGRLVMAAPSRFHASYLRTHLSVRLQTAARRVDPSLAGIVIEVAQG